MKMQPMQFAALLVLTIAWLITAKAPAAVTTDTLGFNKLITSTDTSDSFSTLITVTDADSGQQATFQLTLASATGELWQKLDGNSRAGIGLAGSDGNHVAPGEDPTFTVSLVSKDPYIDSVGFNISALGMRDLVTPLTSWTSSVTTTAVVHNDWNSETDLAMDSASAFHAIDSSNYVGTLAVTGDSGTSLFQLSDNGAASGITYNVSLDVNPLAHLVGHWTFDDGAGSTAADSAGSNPGTLTNMNTATAWTAGQIGGALQFDGADDYVNVGSAGAGSDLDVDGPTTISAWINTPNIDRVHNAIFTRGEWSDGHSLLIKGDTDGPEQSDLWTSNNLQAGNLDSENAWYHIVLTDDGVTTSLYVNGSLVGSAASSVVSSAHETWIGAEGYLTGRWFFQGLIDDVALFDAALDIDIIQQIYTAGLAGNDIETALTAAVPTPAALPAGLMLLGALVMRRRQK